MEFDYEPHLEPPSYDDAGSPLVVRGVVKGFAGSFESTAYVGVPQSFTTLTIEIDHVVHGGSQTTGKADIIYVPIFQGPKDSKTGAPITSPDDFSKAVPVGTAVLVIVGEASDTLKKDFARSHVAPEGTDPVGVGPQTVYFETCDGLVGGLDEIPKTNAWSQIKSLDDLESAIQRPA